MQHLYPRSFRSFLEIGTFVFPPHESCRMIVIQKISEGETNIMTMTVRKILELPPMQGLKLIAGEGGIDKNQVHSVTVLDAPDACSWVRKGDFIMSSGYLFRDSPKSLEKTLSDLHANQAAGLGIKIHRFIKTVPQKVLDLANELEFPLVHVPNHFAFADVIHPVLSEIVNCQERLLRYSETVRRSFFDLCINAADLLTILEHLKNFIHKPFAFVNVLTGERHFFGPAEFLHQQFETMALRDILCSIPSDPVALNGKIYGYLVFDCPPEVLMEKSFEIPITQAKGAILLYMQRRIAEIQAESRYRNEFVQDILIHNLRFEGEVWNRAKMFGWDLRGPQCVAVIDIDNYKHHFDDTFQGRDLLPVLEGTKRRIYGLCTARMKNTYPSLPYTEMSDSIAFILPVPLDFPAFKKKISPILKEIHDIVREDTHFTVTTGVGNSTESVFDCHTSYEEARKALETVRAAAGGDRVVFWKELGVYKLLGNLNDTDSGQAFYMEYIGPLIKHDQRKKSELLRTLKVLIRNNWQLKAAAVDLSVHYNTIKYRYAKICEVLECTPDDSDQRLNLALSLKLYLMDQDLEKY